MRHAILTAEYLWVHFCVYARAISTAIKGVNLDAGQRHAIAA